MLALPARARILGGLLKRVGDVDLSTFGGRLVFQKTVYFLQAFGFYLGYRFSWYLYGPYSPGLTREGFELTDRLHALAPPDLDYQSERKFRQFLQFIDPIKTDPTRLELLASLHFLQNVHKDWPRDRIIRVLKDKQRYFNEPMIEEAQRFLTTHGLALQDDDSN